MKSLSDLKSSPDVGLPERVVKVCLSAKLVREQEEADEALFEAQAAYEAARVEAQERAEGDRPPARLGSTKLADLERAADEAATKAEEIRSRMEDATVSVLLRGKTVGEWRQWVAKHPARQEEAEPAEFARDRQYAAGVCNIDALVDDLGLWAVKYNDEEPSQAWAEFLVANGVPAQLTLAASHVVALHEQAVDAGKSRIAWRRDRMSALDSE